MLRSNFGLELWLGNNPAVPDTWSPWLHPNDDLEEARRYQALGEIAYMAEKQQQAIAFMRSHPLETLNFTFRRFVNNWLAVNDSPIDSWSSSPLYLKLFVVMNIFLSLFTFFGALLAYRAKNPEAAPYALVILIFPLVFYVTHASLRYRFPMDPVMMILAASATCHLLAAAWRRAVHSPSTAAPLGPLPTT